MDLSEKKEVLLESSFIFGVCVVSCHQKLFKFVMSMRVGGRPGCLPTNPEKDF